MKRNNKRQNLLARIPYSIIFWTVFALVMTILFFYNKASISKTVTKLQGVPVPQDSKNVAQEVQNIVEKKVKTNEDAVKNLDTQINKQENKSLDKTETEEELAMTSTTGDTEESIQPDGEQI